jgi:hypothetical protein
VAEERVPTAMTQASDLRNTKLEELEKELDLLVKDYATTPPRLSLDQLIEGTGRLFITQCLRKSGLEGYQIAQGGIRAIIDALRHRTH